MGFLGVYIAFEQVDIYNCTNGQRFTTYVIYGNPGEICLNGAAARLVQPGDEVIIASYAVFSESEITSHQPQLVFVNKDNSVKEVKSFIDAGVNAAY